MGLGSTSSILFAALQAIPREMYEAARIDGAQFWRIIRSITLPLLRRPLGFCFIMATIFNFSCSTPSTS